MRAVLSHTYLFVAALVATQGCAASAPRLANPLATWEDSCIYFPTRWPEGDWQPASLAFEDAWFPSADGTRLHGWFCPHPHPRAVVLCAHGNAGNVSDLARPLAFLRDRFRLTLLAFDYRGYGRSSGAPDEHGILADARAARAWLAVRTGISERQIVLMGRSLGGGVVVDLAANDGARGLILESTFTSLPDAAAVHAPLVPVRLLMHNRFDSLAKIDHYRGPLLVSHGDADRVIPFDQGQRLFAAANEPKRFITIPGGDHNDPQTQEYYAALDEFLEALP